MSVFVPIVFGLHFACVLCVRVCFGSALCVCCVGVLVLSRLDTMGFSYFPIVQQTLVFVIVFAHFSSYFNLRVRRLRFCLRTPVKFDLSVPRCIQQGVYSVPVGTVGCIWGTDLGTLQACCPIGCLGQLVRLARSP